VPARSIKLASGVVELLGGRYSSELGIDVDRGDPEVERWFVAATLFGTRISTRIAGRAFAELDRAGIRRIVDAGDREWEELVALLDAGGYARYDFRTATRLQELARVVSTRYRGSVPSMAKDVSDGDKLCAIFDELPGWGPVTVELFLRELRGTWPAVHLPLSDRAGDAGHHLGLLAKRKGDDLGVVNELAAGSGHDPRDLEAALVRLDIAHRKVKECPGGARCLLLSAPDVRGAV
jgi:hypothetical protein